MHRVTFPWELKMINTTDDCPDAGGGERVCVCVGGGGAVDGGPAVAGLPSARFPGSSLPLTHQLSCEPALPAPVPADSAYELFGVVVHMGAHPNHGARAGQAGCNSYAALLHTEAPCGQQTCGVSHVLELQLPAVLPPRAAIRRLQGTTWRWCAAPAGPGCASMMSRCTL